MSDIRPLVFAVLVAISGASAQASNLVANGSFELPGPGAPAQHFAVSSTAITGWTVIGDTTTILRGNCCLPVTPFDGQQYLDLTGPNDGLRRFGGVSQNITTTVGQSYLLSFQQGNYQFNSPAFDGGTVGLTASAGGTSQTFIVPAVASGAIWVPQTLSFTAVSGLTSISFLGTAGQYYIGLDDVSVTAVPEPGAWLLLSVGIAALTLVRARKSAS